MPKPLTETNFPNLTLWRKGKVRDVYIFDTSLLMVATDRISAFDVIMNEGIPTKGMLLTQLSKFWFYKTQHIVPNHFISDTLSVFPPETYEYAPQLRGRSMLVQKTNPLPIECVVRGYLAGSGWKEYQQFQTVCGVPLPAGLQESSKLPFPIFTPATKAEEGHDENITFERAKEIVGPIAETVKKISIELYNFASSYLEQQGIILADTKFEFGVTENGVLLLIDEALTPDSSRYWLQSQYAVGTSQYNFDKQVLRDYLESIPWNKQYPPPELPIEIQEKVLEKYKEAFAYVTGEEFHWEQYG